MWSTMGTKMAGSILRDTASGVREEGRTLRASSPAWLSLAVQLLWPPSPVAVALPPARVLLLRVHA